MFCRFNKKIICGHLNLCIANLNTYILYLKLYLLRFELMIWVITTD